MPVASPAAEVTVTCDDLMQRHPVSVPPSLAVSVAAEMMTRHGRSWLPVVRETDRHLVGIIREHDIVAHVIAAGRDAKATAVETAMQQPAAACRAGDPLTRAVALMRQHHLSGVPVVDAAGTLIGVVDLQGIHDAQAGVPAEVDGDPERLLG